jgi:predicted aspartyl protease
MADVPDTDSAAPEAVRVFEIISGSEFVAAFAASEAELPDDSVRRELRIIARHGRNVPTRGVADTLLSDGIAGVVGTGAWLTLAATFTATSAWLRRLSQRGKVHDAATVADRLRTASEHILGSAPSSFDKTFIQQHKDGHWHAEFTCNNVRVTAKIDSTGSVIAWEHVQTAQAGLPPGQP